MKMSFKAILALLCAVMMLFAFAACGEDTTEPENDGEAVTDNADNGEQEQQAAPGKFSSVEEYAASDAIQAPLADMNKSLEASGMQVAITGEDNKLVYTFTYTVEVPTEGLAEKLAEALQPQVQTYTSVALQLEQAVEGLENASVEVRYLTMDGTSICSIEFPAHPAE